MISLKYQNELFKLISSKLKKDIICYAFGGTAMMYYGYKNSTKDIDLLFLTEQDSKEFIEVLEDFNYTKSSPKFIYNEELLKKKGKPIMLSKGDERFDIFAKDIFTIELSENMKKRVGLRHDFTMANNSIIIYVLSKEDIILLKSITDREKDMDDIISIINSEKEIDWNYIVEEAINQSKRGNLWIILNLEEKLQRIKKITFIKEEILNKLYKSFEKLHKNKL